MDRCIKFRVWDTENKRMIEHEKVNYSILQNREEHRFKLMQFTGLKDKNKKEIYEGDIVKGEQTVVWNHDMASFELEDSQGAYEVEGFECCEQWVEVIGNIYETSVAKNETKY